MARPVTPVGAWGEISVKQISDTRWQAHARIRQADGRSRQVRISGESRPKAINNLKKKLTRLAAEITSGTVDKETRFGVLADQWLDELTRDYKLAKKPGTTPRLYRGYVKNWVRPALGELQAREVRAKQCDDLIQRGAEKSYETAASVRSVLRGICSYAIRVGAMDVNPAKSTGRLTRGEKSEVMALTLEQRTDLVAKLEALGAAKQTDSRGWSLGRRGTVWLQLPDIMRAMLCTGVRLGELLALTGEEVDPTAPNVLVAYHLVRESGVGLVRYENRKGNGRGLLLGVPQWSVPMWRRLKLASGGGVLFPSWNGEFSDPSNVINRIQEAMAHEMVGYGWVTSHVWRKTVATVLDEADLPTTAIADQLGNTPKVVEQSYRRKRETNQQAVVALEGMVAQ